MKWYKQLSDSEQKLLKIGSIVIVVAIAWAFIYQPINKTIKSKIHKKAVLQQQYKQMLSTQDVLEKQKIIAKAFQRNLNKPFISWIDEQLEKHQLSQYVTRSEPKDNQTLILTFESIIFDQLVSWLEPLEVNYGVIISEADINVLDRTNGLSNARITLEEQ